MPNSRSQMITDLLDWRHIWGSGRPRKGCNGHTAVLPWCHGSILELTVFRRQWHPIPSPAVGVVCLCQAKAELRRLPRGLHTRTRLRTRLNLDSSLKTTWFHSAAVQFRPVSHHSKRMHRLGGIKGSSRNGCHYSKCPLAKRLRMV
ncbi:uncharacterized protein TNCV_2463021 [Trichonephila clavipes]|nr:uncharacterized protein TNCV_2463021 [Trichonephila clavipes]